MRAVIFDVDGTLLDSAAEDEAIYRQAVEKVVGNVRFRAALGDYEQVTDSGILLQTLSDNGIEFAEKIQREVKSAFFELLLRHIGRSGGFEEIPGAKRLLARLRASPDHAVAIATGGWARSARMKLEAAGFDIDGIPLASADDAVERMDIMRFAYHALGEDCGSVTYFGDGPWDRDACNRLGWSFRPVGAALDGLSSFDDAALESLI